MQYSLKAVTESLTIGRVLSNETFSGKRHTFDIPIIENIVPFSKNYFIESFRYSLENSCRGKSTIGLALSGGKDCRTILALLLDIGIKPECVTWSYKETDPEVVVAKKICTKLGLTHKYIKITPELYFIKENENKIFELTDGSSLYFDIMLWYGIKDQLNYDIIFNGNLMTEYMDTAEYRIYEGKNLREALLRKETITNFISDELFDHTYNKLKVFYRSLDIHQVIIERMLDRIIQYNIMKNFINWNYPILNKDLLRILFSFPLRERSGSRLTHSMIRKVNPTLYKMPTARSPFSLRYPLIVHQAYQKISRRKISKGFEHLLPQYLEKNDSILNLVDYYDFIEGEKLKKFLDGERGRTYRLGFSRLLNLYKWTLKNENTTS